MKNVITILMVALLALSLVACTDTNNTDLDMQQAESETTIEIDNTEGAVISTEEPEEPALVYAEDAIVNRFITEFNEKTKYEMTDISKGNIRTKFFAYANDCYVEMINANDAAAECSSISINGGKETSERDKMFEVFAETIKILDPSVTEEKIAEVVN